MAGPGVKVTDRSRDGVSLYGFGLLAAVVAAFGYTLASFCLKAVIGRGVTGAQVNLAANVAMGLVAQPLWLLANPGVREAPPGLPLLCGLIFLLGQGFTFAALATGDVSVATPALSTKIIWVTVINALIFSIPVSLRWWIASVAASIAVTVIASAGSRESRAHSARTAILALCAALLYSCADVLVQRWAARYDSFAFLALMFGTVGLFSLVWCGATDRRAFRISSACIPLLAAGAVLLAIQSIFVFLSLAWTADATATNILYSLRSLLSVICAWAFGRAFGLAEAAASARVMGLRFAGALLLFGAILLILWK